MTWSHNFLVDYQAVKERAIAGWHPYSIELPVFL